MQDIWRLLSGAVPGGFGLLLVAIVAFLIIWRHVYRVGQTLPAKSYQRWRLRLPLIFLLVYFIFWVQSPPKLTPLRVAVLAQETPAGTEWACQAAADLTARRLKRAFKKVVINPWAGAQAYAVPSVTTLLQAGYRVYLITCDAPRSGGAIHYTLLRAGGDQRAFPATDHALLELSAQMYEWMLHDLGKKAAITAPFDGNPSIEMLESYYRALDAIKRTATDSAATLPEAVLQIDAQFAPVRILLGEAYEKGGRQDLAVAQLLEAVRLDTGRGEALLALGEYYLRQLEWEGAEVAFKIAWSRDATCVRAAAGLSKIHPERLKDVRLNTPEKLLEEALRLDPAFESARLLWADRLAEGGSGNIAAKSLRKGLELNPGSLDLLLKLGAIELKLGHPQAAREVYERILRNDPMNSLALFNLGVVDYRTKQYDQAIQRFETVQGLHGPVDCYFYLGLIYQIKGDAARARFYFQRRWELRSSDSDAYAVKARDMVAAIDGKSGG
jgi:tetratricopeptide (TPR) repeat protein